ncbi:MAG: group II intron maturase-specific domain-containing protein [Lachnospiraceae bacterium]
MEKLNQLIRGWINYFKIGSMKTIGVCMCIWKQWKTPQNREKNLP